MRSWRSTEPVNTVRRNEQTLTIKGPLSKTTGPCNSNNPQPPSTGQIEGWPNCITLYIPRLSRTPIGEWQHTFTLSLVLNIKENLNKRRNLVNSTTVGGKNFPPILYINFRHSYWLSNYACNSSCSYKLASRLLLLKLIFFLEKPSVVT